MKLTIFDEKKSNEDKELFFTLKKSRLDHLCLVMVDDDGDTLISGSILSIDPAGTLYLPRGISPYLGLELDDEGRIKINNEDD